MEGKCKMNNKAFSLGSRRWHAILQPVYNDVNMELKTCMSTDIHKCLVRHAWTQHAIVKENPIYHNLYIRTPNHVL